MTMQKEWWDTANWSPDTVRILSICFMLFIVRTVGPWLLTFLKEGFAAWSIHINKNEENQKSNKTIYHPQPSNEFNQATLENNKIEVLSNLQSSIKGNPMTPNTKYKIKTFFAAAAIVLGLEMAHDINRLEDEIIPKI